ncbi:MAG: RICIN domain-containing protein [Eggerthellaceae bacterium]|jgi:hypothetical protein
MRKRTQAVVSGALVLVLALGGVGGASPLAFAQGAAGGSDASTASTESAAADASGVAGTSAEIQEGTSTASEGSSQNGATSSSASGESSSSASGSSNASGSSGTSSSSASGSSGSSASSSSSSKATAKPTRAQKVAKAIKSAKTKVYSSKAVGLKFSSAAALAVSGTSQSGAVKSAKYSGSSKQRFYLTRVSSKSNYMLLRSSVTGQALAAQGTAVVQKVTAKGKSQQWKLLYLSSYKAYVLKNRATGKYLSIAALKSGQQVKLTSASDAAYKTFKVVSRKAAYMLDKRKLQSILNSATNAKKIKMMNAGYSLSKSHLAGLKKAVNGIHRYGCNVSFVVVDMQTGEGFAYDADKVRPAASTVKCTYITAIHKYHPNSVSRYRSTVHDVIWWSDNQAYLKMRGIYGSSPMAKQMKEAGVYGDFSSKNPWVSYSARTLGKLWTANYEFLRSGKKQSSYLLGLFRHPDASTIRQLFDGKNGMKTWTKSGWIYGPATWNESGVVMDKNGHTYLVSVMTSMNSGSSSAWPHMRQMLRAINSAAADLRY